MIQWLTNLFSDKRTPRKSTSRVTKSSNRKDRNIRRSPKRRSPKRRSPKRRSPKRRSPKRRSPKRRSPKRRSPKRRSPKRRSPKRRSPKRRSPKRRSPKRRSPKRRSPKRRSPKRRRPSAAGALKKKIKSTDWFIVTMKGCGYCSEAKKILRSRGLKYKSIVLTDKNQKKIWDVTDKIAKKKYRYFPMIFRKGKFIGGYGELKDRYS